MHSMLPLPSEDSGDDVQDFKMALSCCAQEFRGEQKSPGQWRAEMMPLQTAKEPQQEIPMGAPFGLCF